VLVAPDMVLTAGHCAGGIDAVKLRTNDLDKPGEVINVIQTIEYPNSWRNYDIAVLLLAQPSTVEPRLIAQGCVLDRYLEVGAPVSIVGYGAVDQWGERYVTALMEAETTVTDPDCTSIDRGCNESVSPGGEIGAGGDGIDTCYGDSGGPMYLLTEKGDFLIGITSRAWNDVSVDCGEGGIYGRPDAIIDWIEQETGYRLPMPTCNLAPLASADPIEVDAGSAATSRITVTDPDTADTHVFAVKEAPAHGEATVAADGTVEFQAADGYEGADRLVITVTDDGEPAMSTDVEIPITILAAAGGCGCSLERRDLGAGSWLLLALAVAALRATGYRRRRGLGG
jgi:VCBS repeat-containing protein